MGDVDVSPFGGIQVKRYYELETGVIKAGYDLPEKKAAGYQVEIYVTIDGDQKSSGKIKANPAEYSVDLPEGWDIIVVQGNIYNNEGKWLAEILPYDVRNTGAIEYELS
ncbi:MAG: hypothetical protein PVH29_01280 [Candidatus Zixiibacteriota bacterium]|jgi:hypothetical protein